MDNMNITSVKYTTDFDGNNSGIKAVIDGVELSVPLSEGNRHYDEIMRQVDEGDLAIADAD